MPSLTTDQDLTAARRPRPKFVGGHLSFVPQSAGKLVIGIEFVFRKLNRMEGLAPTEAVALAKEVIKKVADKGIVLPPAMKTKLQSMAGAS